MGLALVKIFLLTLYKKPLSYCLQRPEFVTDNASPVLDEKTLINVLLERGWATEDDIEAAKMDIGMGMSDETLEKILHKKGIISDKDLVVLNDICALPNSIAGFKILSTIGAGAMGVVYLAEEPDENKKIALKVINSKHCDDKDFIKRFHRETKAMSELQHENIASSIGSGEYKDQLYLAMEFIDGPSLSEILADHGPVPEPYAVRCVKQIAEGLDYAHDKCGIIHRDIKPANILIQREESGKENLNLYIDQDTAKIIDFGLAKSTDGNDDLTMTGLTMGTPHYMAPEQIRGDADMNHRADIYALGATLYHLLTGEPPFDGNSPGAIMLAHINNPIPDPSDTIPSIKSETVSIVKMCLAKETKDRFGTFRAVINACENVLKSFGSDSGTDMRILRKPLKLQNTQSVKRKKQHSPSSSGSTYVPNDAETLEIDSDNLLKSQPGSGSTSRPKSSAHPRPNTKPIARKDTTGYLAAEAALRKMQTEKVRRESTKRIKKTNSTDKPSTRRFTPDQSVAFEEDPTADLGSGKLPWLVLSGAIIALVLSIASRF